MLIHPHEFAGSVEDKEAHLRFFLAVCAYAYEVLDTTLIPDTDFDHLSFEINPEQLTGMAELDGFFSSGLFDPSTGSWVHSLPPDLLAPVREAAEAWVAELPCKVTYQAMTPEETAAVGELIAALDGTEPRLSLNNLCRLDTGMWQANVRSWPSAALRSNDIFHEFGAGPTPYHALVACFKKAGLNLEEAS